MNLTSDHLLRAGSLAANDQISHILAASITKAASKQSYYTIRTLADRTRRADAYRAYAYFRWVDDTLDEVMSGKNERLAFINQQKTLIERCYRGDWPANPLPEERLLCDLIRHNPQPNSGMRAYIDNMTAVMQFDAARKGQLIAQAELDNYARLLATAVTEALHYFIGHGQAAPQNKARYLAATGAHVVHMLRDAIDDTNNGYFNIPHEFLTANHIEPGDIDSAPYRKWVRSRVNLARNQFEGGCAYLAQVENLRCRLAGYAYIARFELVLEAIERDEYRLRAAYPERKTKRAALKMGWSAITQALKPYRPQNTPDPLLARS